jgi:Ser/Thr protein kinase RdoA (MazF antagonist)
MSGLDGLTDVQRQLVEGWLPGLVVVRDHSWGLVGTTVLEVEHRGERYVVKAADEKDHHLAREVRAHREWLTPWTERGRGPVLAHADVTARVIVTGFLPGVLVQGTEHERDPATYRQAGELLALLHGQERHEAPGFEAQARDRSLAWLDRPHRIAPEVEARLRDLLGSWPTPTAVLVPTHGDWQPRNWLVHDGVVSVIDLGRADLRPAMTDLARLAAQQLRGAPDLEAAFLDGYGSDPREPEAWRRLLVHEAVGTAVWAYQVGDEAFEQQGHRMIAEALDNW